MKNFKNVFLMLKIHTEYKKNKKQNGFLSLLQSPSE